jgi:hypothetical protein
MSGDDVLEKHTRLILESQDIQGQVAWIRADHWVNTPSSLCAFQWMEYLFRSERQIRPDCMQVVAASGMGKTALFRKFAELHPIVNTADSLRLHRPLLLANAVVGEAGEKGLRCALMRAAWPEARSVQKFSSREECDLTFREQGIKLVLIDDAGELLTAGPSTHKKVLSELKRVSTENSANLVCATTESLRNVMASDEQLKKRFRKVVEIPLWSDSQAFRNFIAGIESYLPFPERSYLDQAKLVSWLLLYGEGNTQDILNLVRLAALWGLQRGACHLSADDFEKARTSELPPRVALGRAA